MKASVERYVEGDNYHIELNGPLALYRVFRRPDLDEAAGARAAEEGLGRLRSLVASGRINGVAFDLTAAPPVVGPRTAAALEDLAIFCKRNRCAFLFISPPPVMRLQVEQLFRRTAHPNAAVVADAAEAYARTVAGPPSSRPRG